MKIRICILLGILMSTFTGFSQQAKLFTVDHELSSSMINHIYQDRDGIIWIATEDGLTSYDGVKFTTLKQDPQSENSLVSSYIRVVKEDKQGHLLIGTLKGLEHYDKAAGMIQTVPLHFESGSYGEANIACMEVRKNGQLIIGTSGHGIFTLEQGNDTLSARQHKDLVPSNFIVRLFEDRQGLLWVLTSDKGTYCITPDRKLKKHYPTEKKILTPSAICEDLQGNIYISCFKNGLFKLNRETDSFMQEIASNTQTRFNIKTLNTIDSTSIYIGTDGGGLKVYDTHKHTLEDLPINSANLDFRIAKVHSFLQDRQGNIWLGLFQKGVLIIPANTNHFQYWGYKSSSHNVIGSSCVMSATKTHDGTYWIGTDNDGLYAVTPDGKQKAHFVRSKNQPQLPPPTIMCIFEDSRHNLWIGSYQNGLARMNPQTGHCRYISLRGTHTPAEELNVYSIVEDNARQIWVGTMGGGLYRINPETEEVYCCPTPSSGLEYRPSLNILHNRWINCLLHTSDDKLYIGTYDGLGCLDIPTMNFTSTYHTNRLLDKEVVYTLYEDKERNIWMGTTQGLVRLNPENGQTETFNTTHGLPSNSVSAIAGDSMDHLWISTSYGLAHFNKQTRTFVNFYAGDGLQGNEFSKGVAYTDQEEIIFGGTGGVTYFHPNDIINRNKEPEIRIADFYIHERQVKVGMKSGGKNIIDVPVTEASHFRLCYKDNSFSIELSAMEFYNPERITYLYRLNNSNWVNLQTGNNRVSFSDLKPGNYHFEIKAKDYNAFSPVKSFTVEITPPWWNTWWANILYMLIVISIIALIIYQIRQRYRTHQTMLEHIHAEQLNEAKLQFFINISHEIRTPMSLIISPLQKLMSVDGSDERQKTYQMIYRNAERILRLVNQLMDIRKIDKGQMQLKFQETEMVGFIQDLYHTFQYQAETKNIQLEFIHQTDELHAWIDPKNFDKVIMNLLSNAFKFTPENGQITIQLTEGTDLHASQSCLQHYLEISIKDSGIGINPAEKQRIFDRFYQVRNSLNYQGTGTGVGLHLSRSLVELHHGIIEVNNNTPEPGCCFTIRIPLGKNHLKAEDIDYTQPVYSSQEKTEAQPIHTENKEETKVRSKTKYRVLVVEDENEIRKYISRELSTTFHTSECCNGKDALDAILKETPDLVISDVMMPEMDGMTLCKKIRQNININHIPVILLTAKNREEDNLEGLEIGADAYITKPFNIDILQQTALNLIKSREVLKNAFQGNQEQEERMEKIVVESPDEKLLNRVMKVINSNLSNPKLNVEMIASSVGISRVHLHRKLKELTNQTTRDLIKNIRLRQAATLLAEKKHSIAEIANLTGFSNTAYFSNSFKEMYGVSPTTYMEQNAEKGEEE